MYHYIVGGAGLFLGLIAIAVLDDLTSAANKRTQTICDRIRRGNEESTAQKIHLRDRYRERVQDELAGFREKLSAASQLKRTLLLEALAALEKKLESAQSMGECALLTKQIENLRQSLS